MISPIKKISNLFKKKSTALVLKTKGILNSHKAFIGPEIAQIDITNNCNLNCVGCWCHSELMDELKFDPEKKKVHLSMPIIKKLVDELKEMGIKEIQLSGSGDPITHPNIMEILEYIKLKNIYLHLITNFTLLTKENIKHIVDLNVDKITVSLWAGTAETYVKTHPNQTEKTFYKIKENLIYLKKLKTEKNLPKIRIYNVISSLNYHEIEEMINFALETRADFIEFQTVDVVPGKSDKLSLKNNQREQIISEFNRISLREDILEVPANKKLTYLDKENQKKEFKEFSRFVNKNSFAHGFKYYLEDISCYRVKCPADNWHISVEEDNIHENTLKFYYNRKTCLSCPKFNTCLIGKKRFLVKAEFLSVLGIGTFFRRLSNLNTEAQEYDVNIVDTMPCYVGWTFTRILPNGDVIPCCKAHKKPLGNLNNNSFKEIWFSEKYNEFRYLAKVKKKSHPYFKEIECYKSCDNVGMNLKTHIKMKFLKRK